MKVQTLTAYYVPFLWNFYSENPNYKHLSYSDLLKLILDQMYADMGAFHYYMGKRGHECQIIISNCEPLQKQWAKENGVKYTDANWQLEIAEAQVKKFKPDIFYIEPVFEFYGEFMRSIRPSCRLIISWISSPFPKDLEMKGIDLFLSSTPKYIEIFKSAGFRAEYMLPAFDARVLDVVKVSKKDIPFSFIGGWGETHYNRRAALQELVKKTPIQLWGYGYKKSFPRRNLAYFKHLLFPENKAILKAFRGELWGKKMYEVLQRSLVTFNIHEILLQGNVGNMRMFEATGAGAMLLNDDGHNLSKLFEAGKEIVVYKTIDEAIEKANYYIAHPQEAKEIGSNGQKRTLKDYNYENYVSSLLDFSKKIM